MAQVPPAFPYAASTILNTRPNQVILTGAIEQYHQEAASDDSSSIFPGMLLAKQSDAGVKRHGIMGGDAQLLVAKEDALQGHALMDAYALTDLVSYHVAQKGDVMLILVDASAAAVVTGSFLCSAGDGTFMLNPGSGFQLYEAVASSAVITNTTSETVFNNSYSVPANALQPGDVIRLNASASCPSTHSTDTLTVKLKIGTTVVATSATLDVANADLVTVTATLVVRTIGASGTFVAEGTISIGPAASATVKAFQLASTALDTTVAELLSLTATWSVADPGNQVQLDVLDISMERAMKSLVVAEESVDNSANSSTMAYVIARVI